MLKNILLILTSLLCFNVFAQDSLLAHYNLDGNAKDATANGYHAIAESGKYTQDRFGNDNSAYLFNSFSTHINQ